MERFFTAAATGRRPVGILASSLACRGETIAAAISFTCRDQVFGHILAHDPRFDKQGVGVLLAEQAFRSACEAGYARFDMLPPDDAYKMDWACGAIDVDDWALPLTGRGAAYMRLWLGGGRAALKAMNERMPGWLGRALTPVARMLHR